MTGKDELLNTLLSNKTWISEKLFKLKFPKHYADIENMFCKSQDMFSFKQKLYHYLHDDNGLTLGLCRVCGKRCKFVNVNTGYHECCSAKCAGKYEKTREKIRQTNLGRYGVEYGIQAESVKAKSKETCVKKYGVFNPMQNTGVQSKMHSTNIDRYGTAWAAQSDTVREKIRQTDMERYGAECPMQNKEVRTKGKKTIKEKYGVNHYSQTTEFVEKYRKTCKKRIGVEFPMQSAAIRQKVRRTNIAKYGVEHPMQNTGILNKVKRTNIGRYGCENVFGSQEIRNKSIDTLLKNHGVDNPAKSAEIQEKIASTNFKRYGSRRPAFNRQYSNGELELLEFISNIYSGKIITNDRIMLNGLELDIFLPELGLAFEYNGDFWHMNPEKYAASDIHPMIGLTAAEIWAHDKLKNDIAESMGIKIYVIWDSEWKSAEHKIILCKRISSLIKNGN